MKHAQLKKFSWWCQQHQFWTRLFWSWSPLALFQQLYGHVLRLETSLGGKNVHNGHQWSMQMGLYHLEYDTTWLTQSVWLPAGNWAHNFISAVIKHNTMWLLEIELLREISISGKRPLSPKSNCTDGEVMDETRKCRTAGMVDTWFKGVE